MQLNCLVEHNSLKLETFSRFFFGLLKNVNIFDFENTKVTIMWLIFLFSFFMILSYFWCSFIAIDVFEVELII